VSTEANRTEVQPGDVLAEKYRVERVLGAGGMGVVVEATHLLLSERVALKFLLPQALEDEPSKVRFLREAQAAARIKSPHVARVTDVGSLPNGAPYIVMELLEGTSLERLFDAEGKLPVEQACNLMLQACEGLAAAHAVGVIHRDIKPSNLFLTTANDGSTLLKVLDFGISKVLDPSENPINPLTQTQVTMGSPLFMAPEQMRSSRKVDMRADVWSLGIVLYEALAGRGPFEADSLPQLCAMVLDGEVAPLGELRPELPVPLIEAIMRCLKVAPEDRFQDVSAFAAAIAPFAGPGAEASVTRCGRILHGHSHSSLPVSSEAPAPEPELAVVGKDTNATFERTAAPTITARLTRFGRALAAGAILLGTGAVSLWWLMRPLPSQAPSAESGSAAPAEPALATAPVDSLAALPPATATAPATPSATATATATAATATATGTGRATAPRPATATVGKPKGTPASNTVPASPAADDPFSARR